MFLKQDANMRQLAIFIVMLEEEIFGLLKRSAEWKIFLYTRLAIILKRLMDLTTARIAGI